MAEDVFASLSRLAGQIAKTDGDYKTESPGLMIYRRSVVTEPMPCIYGLGLGVTIQGGKRVSLGNDIYDYGPGQSVMTYVDLPVVSYVSQATHSEPYLGLRLELDARAISQAAAGIESSKRMSGASLRGISVAELDNGLLTALTRLLEILSEPSLLPHIGPLIEQEIIVRLLHGEHAPMLQHLVTAGSPSQQIARVMAWMGKNYTTELSMDELAKMAHMSPSTFRQHFRAVAEVSPLQYLKYLRLQNARQLLLNEESDAGSVALRVGYESASQFSREYSRLFGEPPQRDLKRIRAVETAQLGD